MSPLASNESGRVWVTRAEPGAARTATRLAALGYTPVITPLLAIRPIPQGAPDLTGAAALAFTSRNGVAAFAYLTPDRGLPVLTVGDATAAAARDAGFTDVISADGDLAALAALIRSLGFTPDALILNPGAREPAGDLAAAVGETPKVRALPLYEAVETNAEAPNGCDAVLLHSPRAARALAARLAPEAAKTLIALAISPAAAAPLAALPFAATHVAPHPNEDGLLATLGKALPPV